MRFGVEAISLMLCLFGCAAIASPAFGSEAHAEEKSAFAPVIDTVLIEFIQPSYADLVAKAELQSKAVEALCVTPNQGNLDKARSTFADVVAAWSRVEMFRFGPAREGNSFEKLFYWPDRKGRGLKQVQAILASEESTAAASDSLKSKSVAVQGLPALEFVLFGTGSDALATEAGFRCNYGLAIAQTIQLNAAAMESGWSGNGYAQTMRSAGPDNAVYKSHGEVIQDLLRAASEQLQIVRDLKIGASIGQTADKSKPKRGPLWRSDLTISSITANVEAVEALLDAGISELLSGEHTRLKDSVSFELAQAKRAIGDSANAGDDWLSIVGAQEGRGKLVAATFPLQGAIRIVGERYPAALGLTLGFNSLDGD